MILNTNKGSYMRGVPITLKGSFVVPAVVTNSPTVLRDGGSKCITSVVRVSAGLYTVTFDAGFPIPERLVASRIDHAPATAVPALDVTAKMLATSYSMTTRSFQIQLTVPTGATTQAASDGITGDVVSFSLHGSISSIGTDPA